MKINLLACSWNTDRLRWSSQSPRVSLVPMCLSCLPIICTPLNLPQTLVLIYDLSELPLPEAEVLSFLKGKPIQLSKKAICKANVWKHRATFSTLLCTLIKQWHWKKKKKWSIQNEKGWISKICFDNKIHEWSSFPALSFSWHGHLWEWGTRVGCNLHLQVTLHAVWISQCSCEHETN